MKKLNIKIDEIKKLADNYRFSGSIYIKKGNTDFTFTHGFEDEAMTIPFSEKTKFLFSEYNWSLLCIAALQLIENKRLDIESYVSDYIDSFKHGHRVKVKHLIHRNSQIVDYVSSILANNDQYKNADIVEKTKKDYLYEMQTVNLGLFYKTINQYDLLKEPGALYGFSFSELLILKDIIEHITAMSFMKYVSTYILDANQISYELGHTSNVSMFGQNNENYKISIDTPKDMVDSLTLNINSIKLFQDCLINHKFFSKDTYEVSKTMFQDIGIGFFDDGNYYTYWFHTGGHVIEINYFPKMKLTMLLTYNYAGDILFQEGKWESFLGKLNKIIISQFIKPKKPKLVSVNKLNRAALLSIKIDEYQNKFVPNVYKCIAYSYMDKTSKNYILQDQGQTIGMVTLHVDKKNNDYSIRFLQIDKHYQNKGYGKILVNLACDKLKSFGATRLEIGVISYNESAYHLYKSCGFIELENYANFIELYKKL